MDMAARRVRWPFVEVYGRAAEFMAGRFLKIPARRCIWPFVERYGRASRDMAIRRCLWPRVA